MKTLTTRLEELEMYISSSEDKLDKISKGDKVISTIRPNNGRTDAIVQAEAYWITVEEDWPVVLKNRKTSNEFKKSRHILRLTKE